MTSVDRFLIVNGDDFGRSEAVNAGVAKAFREGVLTSASIVANGPAFGSAVALAGELDGLGLGIHLALNEYEPVLPPSEIPSLVTRDGKFRRRGQQFLTMIISPRTRDEIFREWDAQISKVLAAGINLEHIDGHGHCHAHPRVGSVIVGLAERYGISHVRLPVESLGWRPERRSASRLLQKIALNSFALCSRQLWGKRLSCPQYFYGFSDGGHLSTSVVRRVARGVRPGVSELMVHVGTSNVESAGLKTAFDRKADLDAVTSFDKPSFEKEFDVKLVSHTGRRP
jgi:predicted glycoside hydrolase/deacetylase ChbG (UPF0249 family)